MGCSSSAPADTAPAATARTKRGAISAKRVEAGDVDGYVPAVHKKTASVLAHLKEVMQANVLFEHLERDELKAVMDAMYEHPVKGGENVITQGEDGDVFYIMNGGEVDVIVDGIKVSSITKTGSFGELALMYGTLRQATIKATADMVLYAMDGMAYKHLIMSSSLKKREQYDEILKKVKILEELDSWERKQVADALEAAYFEDGVSIVKQGDTGNEFFIILEGTAIVTQTNDAGESGQVAELGPADFFGEIAMLTQETRKATVTAKGDVKCVKLDRNRFERVLGPCDDVMRRNLATYKPYSSRPGSAEKSS